MTTTSRAARSRGRGQLLGPRVEHHDVGGQARRPGHLEPLAGGDHDRLHLAEVAPHATQLGGVVRPLADHDDRVAP